MSSNKTSKTSAKRAPDTAALLRSQLEARLDECARLIDSGVDIIDPMTTYIEAGTEIGPGTVIYPNTTISGQTIIGRDCRIGPNSIIVDSRIGDESAVLASVVEESALEPGVDVGPFSHLRAGTYLEEDVHIGNFVEIKNSRLGRGTRAGHFSYIGDAQVGSEVNIGAGTVTCNFDGRAKHETIIGDESFIGSDTMLVAPVRLGKRSATGAGSVVTRDVPEGGRVAGVPARAVQGGGTRPRGPTRSG